MLVKANWTGKDEYHQSKREALWVYNEVKMLKMWFSMLLNPLNNLIRKLEDQRIKFSIYNRKQLNMI